MQTCIDAGRFCASPRLTMEEIGKSSAYTSNKTFFNGADEAKEQHESGQRSRSFTTYLDNMAAFAKDAARTHETAYTPANAFERLLEHIVIHEVSDVTESEARKLINKWSGYISRAKDQFIADCSPKNATEKEAAYDPKCDVFTQTCDMLTQNITYNKSNLAYCTTKHSNVPENKATLQVKMIQRVIKELEAALYSSRCRPASPDAPMLINGAAYVSADSVGPARGVRITEEQLKKIDPLHGESYLTALTRRIRENEENPGIVSGIAAAVVGVNLDGTSDYPDLYANQHFDPSNDQDSNDQDSNDQDLNDHDPNVQDPIDDFSENGGLDDDDLIQAEYFDQRNRGRMSTEGLTLSKPNLGDQEKCVMFLLTLQRACDSTTPEGEPWTSTMIKGKILDVLQNCTDDLYMTYIASALWVAMIFDEVVESKRQTIVPNRIFG